MSAGKWIQLDLDGRVSICTNIANSHGSDEATNIESMTPSPTGEQETHARVAGLLKRVVERRNQWTPPLSTVAKNEALGRLHSSLTIAQIRYAMWHEPWRIEKLGKSEGLN